MKRVFLFLLLVLILLKAVFRHDLINLSHQNCKNMWYAFFRVKKDICFSLLTLEPMVQQCFVQAIEELSLPTEGHVL